MKLEKIKLAGFKSFVDPTTIPIQGNLTAIVGPNGCGKSNIIDAVRWVMGESSAKHLRGGSMTDVIFNGSSGRKPVGMASVELVFDNSAGRAAGHYAQYESISIKRQVSRDGQSVFMLNGMRCRRKDITDLFLGTGLGSRSYAIIEQGTISRLVEAKPDELRLHIEEAAGISKYKERRAETETRMRHTRENLERLTDLRDEVDKQIKNLARQAQKAEKYTELKQLERQARLAVLALRWRGFQAAVDDLEQKLQAVAGEHNRLFVLLRQTESDASGQRGEQKHLQEEIDAVQEDYYAAAADIGRLEQAIKHHELAQGETRAELNRLLRQAEEAQETCAQDLAQLDEIRAALVAAEDTLSAAKQREEEALERQEDVEGKQQQWRADWETFLTEQAKRREQIEVRRAQRTQWEQQQRQARQRLEKLTQEQGDLHRLALDSAVAELSQRLGELTQEREELQAQAEAAAGDIERLKPEVKQVQATLQQLQAELRETNGKIASLELLQQHAMGKDKHDIMDFLERLGLQGRPRLAEFIETEPGWETAVEIALGDFLQAVCVDDVADYAAALQAEENLSLILFATRPSAAITPQGLLGKINCPWDIADLLPGLDFAFDEGALQQNPPAGRSLITQNGAWRGANWLKISRGEDSQFGLLPREKQLREFKHRQAELDTEITGLSAQLNAAEQALKEAEQRRERQQSLEKQWAAEYAALNAEHSAQAARLEQQNRRLAQLEHEAAEQSELLHELAEQLAEAELYSAGAEKALADLELRKAAMEEALHELTQQRQDGAAHVDEARRHIQRLHAQIESLKASETLTVKQIERLQGQRRQSEQRIAELEHKLEFTLTPLDDEKIELAARQEDKYALEQRLKALRQRQKALEQALQGGLEQAAAAQAGLERQKQLLEDLRLQQQDSRVRQQTVAEQLREAQAEPELILRDLPAETPETQWKTRLDKLNAEIEELGPINLTAIEEYRTQSERLNFLNEQHADLIAALNSLDQAIDKIDKETRQRFQETFNLINNGLKEKFPRLFGGGQAYLELTDADVLEAGVNIIARPPGKRNSSIHLLSGGEKALTAIALVFSIFELNPAPFCLLDEVDAPLDDANVVRFSKMVEDMAETVQFLYISHNKVTMEIARHLTGVTMKEPGVSRMVAVDIDEAVSMAEN